MEVSTKQFKHCDLVEVAGRIDSATSPEFNAALEAVLADNRFKIVIDLSKVEFMSSAGFRVLISAQKECKRYNRGEVVFASIPANIYSALDLAGFNALFRSFDDVTSAVGAF